MSEPLTAAELARITALVAERGQALADLEMADTEREHETADKVYRGSTDDLAEAAPALLAELARLRERLRWRTVSADGLPAAGERVLVERKGRRHFCEVFQDAEDGRNWSGVPFRDGDRWLPVPEESE